MPTAHLGSSADSPNAISIPPEIEIRSLARGDDTTAFRTLNEEWITKYFTFEAKDRETLKRSGALNSSEGRLYLHGLRRP